LRRCSSDQPDDTFFAEELDFAAMGVQSTVLLERLARMGLQRPTAVQSAAFKAIREEDSGDLTIGAETGSGKVSK
jgi:superfamily II DNA/RNA helicase